VRCCSWKFLLCRARQPGRAKYVAPGDSWQDQSYPGCCQPGRQAWSHQGDRVRPDQGVEVGSPVASDQARAPGPLSGEDAPCRGEERPRAHQRTPHRAEAQEIPPIGGPGGLRHPLRPRHPRRLLPGASPAGHRPLVGARPSPTRRREFGIAHARGCPRCPSDESGTPAWPARSQGGCRRPLGQRRPRNEERTSRATQPPAPHPRASPALLRAGGDTSGLNSGGVRTPNRGTRSAPGTTTPPFEPLSPLHERCRACSRAVVRPRGARWGSSGLPSPP